MKRIVLAIILSVPMLAAAQEYHEQGSYWAFTGVDTKPGMMTAYIEDLHGLWRRQMDMLIDAGKVKSYKMLANVHAREGEPDLWLMVEWSSAGAMMDTPYEEWEEMTSKLVGSMDKSRDLSIKRGDIRTIMGDVLTRELIFRD